MKKLFITISFLFSIAYAQQVHFNIIPGSVKYSDDKRFKGDTVFLKIKLQPNITQFLSFQNKAIYKGVQGYLYDAYRGVTVLINPREDYYEFTTTEDSLSFSSQRFYLRLVKCF